jgi:hypothetical protein
MLALAEAREVQSLVERSQMLNRSRFFGEDNNKNKKQIGSKMEWAMREFLRGTSRPTALLKDDVSTFTLEWPALDGSDNDEDETFSCLRLRSWTLNLCFDRPVEAIMHGDEACSVEEAAAALLARRKDLRCHNNTTLWRFHLDDDAVGWWLHAKNLGIRIRFEPAIAPAHPSDPTVRSQLALSTFLLDMWRRQRIELARGGALHHAPTAWELYARRREDDWLEREIECERQFSRCLHGAWETLPGWARARLEKRASYL